MASYPPRQSSAGSPTEISDRSDSVNATQSVEENPAGHDTRLRLHDDNGDERGISGTVVFRVGLGHRG